MHILHAFKVHSPEIVGGIPELIQLLAGTRRFGWRSEVLVARLQGLGRRDLLDGVPVTRTTTFGNLWSMPIAPAYPLRFWRKAARADIVHYHAPFPLIDLSVALRLPRRTGLVVHWHSDIVEQRRARALVAPFIERCLARADRIVVTHPAMLDQSPVLPRFAAKCVVLPYGIRTGQWASLSPEDEREVARLRAAHPRLVVGIGRLVRYKGFEHLIDAMERCDAELAIVGEGVLEPALRARIAERGLGDRVRLAGRLSPDALRHLLHAARVFALSSVTENEAFGLVQVEAMACGKPVVNTRLPTSVPWVARDGEEAITVAPGDPDALAGAVTRLLDDPALAAEMGERGRRRAFDLFSEEAFLAGFDRLYREVAAERQRIRR